MVFFWCCTAGQKAHIVQVKQLRNQAHPDIHEGRPLPDNGTCRHYRKSYRWFRFPCCGKCYPCDECHAESEPDHEMKYATRMICGFCCKEQVATHMCTHCSGRCLDALSRAVYGESGVRFSFGNKMAARRLRKTM